MISQQGQVKKKSLLLGLCQKLILGQKCRYLAKSALFWPNWAPTAALTAAMQQGHHKNIVFCCPVMMVTKILGKVSKKNYFWPKKLQFWSNNYILANIQFLAEP